MTGKSWEWEGVNDDPGFDGLEWREWRESVEAPVSDREEEE
jgi:hypothetical protein